jgi:hypothetical protein
MRNWEQEQIIKKHLLACYIDPETKARIKAIARAKRMSISELARELIELALPKLEQLEARHDHSPRP